MVLTIDTPELTIIGLVSSDIHSLDEAPKGYDESARTGYLEIFPEYREGLEGIEAGQTIMVLFWLHKSARDILKVHPRNRLKQSLHLNGIEIVRPGACQELTRDRRFDPARSNLGFDSVNRPLTCRKPPTRPDNQLSGQITG